MSSFYRILKFKINDQWRSASPLLRGGLISFVFVWLHMTAYNSSLGRGVENYAQSAWYWLRGPRPIPQSVTFVKLDSETFQTIQMPADGLAPRWVFAEALKKIVAAGAKLIVLDFFFIGKDTDHPDSLRLAEALAESPSVIGRSVMVRVKVAADGKRNLTLYHKRPSKQFEAKAKEIAPLQVQGDRDGLVRKITVRPEVLDEYDTPTPLLKSLRRFVEPDLRQPGPDDEINYYGPPFSLPNLSLAELIKPDGNPSPEYFRDRVVLIGGAMPVAPGKPGKDSFRTPISSTEMYGVEIHATIVANLLDGSWIRRAEPSQELIALSLAAFGSLLLLLTLTPNLAGLATVAMAVLWSAVAYMTFTRMYLSIPGALWFVVCLPIFSFVRWAVARRHKLTLDVD